MNSGITTHIDGNRLDIVLEREGRRNSQTEETWIELARIGREVAPDFQVIVIRASGESFSSGLDKDVFLGNANPNFQQLLMKPDSELEKSISEFQEAFTWLRKSSAISIAQVQGHAIGAGFQLALACDLRFASEKALFSMKEVQLGLVPDLSGTLRLLELTNFSNALDICVTGRTVAAEEMLRMGLINYLTSSENLEEKVNLYVESVLKLPPLAVSSIKQLLGKSHTDQLAAEREHQARLLRSLVPR